MAKRISGVRKRSSRPVAVLPPAPFLLGADSTETILETSPQPMSRQELHLAIDHVVREWLAAACIWKEGWSLGDYRFVVFSVEVAPETKSTFSCGPNPSNPCRGKSRPAAGDPPADEWLAGERSDRIAAFGFAIGGPCKNFYEGGFDTVAC